MSTAHGDRMRFFLGLVFVCWARIAAAQRAELGAHVERESSRLDGFPGTFNAAMQGAGEWRLDIGLTPSLSYGLHEDVSLRASLLPLVSWARVSPGGSAEVRYRLWHDRQFAVVGSFGGSLMEFGDNLALRTVSASLTGEWRYGPRSAVALTLLAGGARFIARGTNDDSQMAPVEQGGIVQGAGVMASYSFFPASWFGFDVGLGFAPALDVGIRQTGASVEVDLSSVAGAKGGLLGRFSLHIRSGRNWLVSLGAVVLPPAVPIPVLGVSRRW